MISPLRGGGKLADKIFNKYNITKEEREEVKNEIASGGGGGGSEEYKYYAIGGIERFEDIPEQIDNFTGIPLSSQSSKILQAVHFLYCEYYCFYMMDRFNTIFSKGYDNMSSAFKSSDNTSTPPYYLFYILIKLPINKKDYVIRTGYNNLKYQIDIKNIQDYYKYFYVFQSTLQYGDPSEEELNEAVNALMEALNPLIMEITEDKYNEVIEYYNNSVE